LNPKPEARRSKIETRKSKQALEAAIEEYAAAKEIPQTVHSNIRSAAKALPETRNLILRAGRARNLYSEGYELEGLITWSQGRGAGSFRHRELEPRNLTPEGETRIPKPEGDPADRARQHPVPEISDNPYILYPKYS